MAETTAGAGRARVAARLAARLATAAALVAAVGALAHLPLGEPVRDAALRVDLRTQLAKVVLCTERSAAELAELPVHMRQARDCRETAIDYRLRVAVDGVVLADRRIAHRGVRHNRPLIVGELFRVAPGDRRVEVDFSPLPPEGFTGELGELPSYRLDERLELAAGRVAIVALADGRLRPLA